MTEKAQSQTLLEIIQPLADSASLVMNFSGDIATDLALEMFSQERQPQAAVFT